MVQTQAHQLRQTKSEPHLASADNSNLRIDYFANHSALVTCGSSWESVQLGTIFSKWWNIECFDFLFYLSNRLFRRLTNDIIYARVRECARISFVWIKYECPINFWYISIQLVESRNNLSYYSPSHPIDLIYGYI